MLAFGLAVTLMAYIPILADKLKISYPLPLVVIGILVYFLGVPVDWPKPVWEHEWVKMMTEIIVIISLMGAGLKIGMRYGMQHWKNPLRLIHTSMPIYISGIVLLAKYLLQFDWASSILLAAVLAPTDPVLASDLQLQHEKLDKDKNTGMRYMLTAEAGLNDGLAFPFVFLAILWSKAGSFEAVDFSLWSGYYFFYKIIIGILVGSIFGFTYSLSIKKTNSFNKSKVLSGFVGIAIAFTAFALAEVMNGYGFLSTFFAGLLAQYHNHADNDEHKKEEMLMFTEELEKFLIVLWTLLFGGFLASGILRYTDFKGIAVAILVLIILRPISGRIGLIGTEFTTRKKWAISFFGIKGVGSFFYLSYAFNETQFRFENELYAIVSYTVVLSIIVHGLSGPRAVNYFEGKNPR